MIRNCNQGFSSLMINLNKKDIYFKIKSKYTPSVANGPIQVIDPNYVFLFYSNNMQTTD